jgi:beta-glucanase (GH16 family)
MKKVLLLLKNLFIISCIVVILPTAQAQVTGEKYVNKPFYEGFDGPVDNQTWLIGTWKEHGGQLSADRCYTRDGLLNMIFINKPGDGYLGSAIQTVDEFLYGRWEAKLKPSNIPGVLNSLYTIDWDNTADESSESDGTKEEIDIEFLTKSFMGKTGEVHIALHERGKKSFNSNPDIMLDFNPSSDFHIWGYDITPEYIEWFVDDKVLHRYVYKDNEIAINAPYVLKLNFWSSENWIGGPPKENVECIYQVDWIRFTPLDLLKTRN